MKRTTLAAAVIVAAAPLAGCYSSVGLSSHTALLEPASVDDTVVGRDCAFHLAGLAFRDLGTRQAARNALEGTRDTGLAHVTARVVYPAPFEVCIEVEGVAVPPSHTVNPAPVVSARAKRIDGLSSPRRRAR